MMNKLTFVLFVYLLTGSTALAQDCGCEGKPLPEVLSIVNGVKITAKDLDPDTQSRVTELKRQVVEARKAELDLQINSMLLEAEAKKRTITSSKLLEEEVVKKAAEPTEADARTFFNEQKARLNFVRQPSNSISQGSHHRPPALRAPAGTREKVRRTFTRRRRSKTPCRRCDSSRETE